MERKRISDIIKITEAVAICILVLALPQQVVAQDVDSLKLRFQHLYLRGEMGPWKNLVDSLRAAKISEAEDDQLLYGEYGLTGYLIGKDEKALARKELDLFLEHVDSRLAKQPKNATLWAFKAATVGYAIGLQPFKAIYLGGDNKDAVDNAIKYHKNEPMPLYELANSLYFRPSFVGGDKKRAAELFEKSLEIYRKTDPNHWMYLNVYAWLGQVYARQGDKEKARKLYLQILAEYPDYVWVKNELLPDLDSDKKQFRFLELEF
ncbi:MAG: tetratricopeptide repeat protein [Bacteroidales bacterium]|nr:tetratricopeptide repeat protein [Bacteroidales bacterium]